MKKHALLASLATLALIAGLRTGFADDPAPWPPEKGKPYPDLELKDAAGNTVKLSSLKGKVLLIEPIGIACPGCNAYAGGNEPGVGGFRGSGVQGGLPSIHALLKDHAKTSLEKEKDLVLVQLLLFDGRSQVGHAPTVEDAKAWSDHFKLTGKKNVLVLVGTDALANRASYDMVPGFQVVDRKFVLRWDGTGHHPKDDPYRKVLASIPELLKERK